MACIFQVIPEKMLMKKIFTLSLLVSVSILANAQVRFGAFMGYAEKIDLWGLGAQVEVIVSDRVGISPSFVYFFPRKLNADVQTTFWEWNANGHYYLINGDKVNFYGLAGFNYSTTRVSTEDVSGDQIVNDYNAGLNLGAGLLFKIDRLLPFAEAKYTAGSYSQFAFFAGVRYQFGSRYRYDEDDDQYLR